MAEIRLLFIKVKKIIFFWKEILEKDRLNTSLKRVAIENLLRLKSKTVG